MFADAGLAVVGGCAGAEAGEFVGQGLRVVGVGGLAWSSLPIQKVQQRRVQQRSERFGELGLDVVVIEPEVGEDAFG
ncbi:MAG: hypothetical protein ACRCYU_23905 [Nocardioides sp.]